MAQLILTYKERVVSKHPVSIGSEITIGRQHDNDIVIDNLAVSGRHAVIRREKEGLQLTDAGSTNGTFVNNERIAKCRLVHQDLIAIGNHSLIVDLYGTLSLEATMQMLRAGALGAKDADQTILFGTISNPSAPPAFDRLIFLEGSQGEYELFKNTISIGKHAQADIVIHGFWSFLAGAPAVTIERQGGNYFLNYIGGLRKPTVNDFPVGSSTKLNHQDIIRIAGLKMQLFLHRDSRN
jgi:pSer/pThr/pTyr-binding forkhead associated (FHA) protein